MTLGPGARVYLKACRGAGPPGTVIRFERGRAVVFWGDMNFWSRHVPASLELAEAPRGRDEQAEEQTFYQQ